MAGVTTLTSIETDHDTILRIHEMWNEVNRTWSLEGFEQYLTDDYVCFAGQGDVIRGLETFMLEFETLSESAKGGRWEMDISDRVIEVAGDAAWVHYEFALRGWFDSEPFNERGRGTEIYRRTADGWKMALGHFSMRQR
jgi:ketosteroid isomerase-like protein